MMTMEAYDAYKIYIALKSHFNGDYDFLKYNGKTNVKVDSFLKIGDRPFFGRVARKYLTSENVKRFYISNFLVNTKGWIGDFNEQNYVDYKKRIESLKYNYKNELQEILRKVKLLDEIFLVNGGQHPLLLKQFLAKKISIETMCILESLMEFTPYWDKNITEKYVWPEQKKLIKNYQSVLTFDKSSYKVETINIVKEHTNEV